MQFYLWYTMYIKVTLDFTLNPNIEDFGKYKSTLSRQHTSPKEEQKENWMTHKVSIIEQSYHSLTSLLTIKIVYWRIKNMILNLARKFPTCIQLANEKKAGCNSIQNPNSIQGIMIDIYWAQYATKVSSQLGPRE